MLIVYKDGTKAFSENQVSKKANCLPCALSPDVAAECALQKEKNKTGE